MSSSSSRMSQLDGEQTTIDAENSVNHNRFYGTRSDSCPANLIRNSAAYKIILNRGIMDGQYMRLLVPQALSFVDTSNTVEVVAMMNITNAAVIADSARVSSEIAIHAANLAVQLSVTQAEVIVAGRIISSEMMLQIALDAVESAMGVAYLARLMSLSSRLSMS